MKIFSSKHSGATSIEWVILTPLMYVTFLVVLYFFFMSLTYIAYNNIANSIAQELNMRQTGYQTAMNNYSSMPTIISYKNDLTGNKTLSASNVQVSPYTSELRSGVYFALSQYKDQFTIPFAEVKSINVETSKAIRVSSGQKLAGTFITVEINYTSMVFGGEGMMMTAIGYNAIS